jgi:hypothetical protein
MAWRYGDKRIGWYGTVHEIWKYCKIQTYDDITIRVRRVPGQGFFVKREKRAGGSPRGIKRTGPPVFLMSSSSGPTPPPSHSYHENYGPLPLLLSYSFFSLCHGQIWPVSAEGEGGKGRAGEGLN